MTLGVRAKNYATAWRGFTQSDLMTCGGGEEILPKMTSFMNSPLFWVWDFSFAYHRMSVSQIGDLHWCGLKSRYPESYQEHSYT